MYLVLVIVCLPYLQSGQHMVSVHDEKKILNVVLGHSPERKLVSITGKDFYTNLDVAFSDAKLIEARYMDIQGQRKVLG